MATPKQSQAFAKHFRSFADVESTENFLFSYPTEIHIADCQCGVWSGSLSVSARVIAEISRWETNLYRQLFKFLIFDDASDQAAAEVSRSLSR